MLGFMAPGNVCPAGAGGGKSCAAADSDHSAPNGAPIEKAFMVWGALWKNDDEVAVVTGGPLRASVCAEQSGSRADAREH